MVDFKVKIVKIKLSPEERARRRAKIVRAILKNG